jgi:hypothetical protein
MQLPIQPPSVLHWTEVGTWYGLEQISRHYADWKLFWFRNRKKVVELINYWWSYGEQTEACQQLIVS